MNIHTSMYVCVCACLGICLYIYRDHVWCVSMHTRVYMCVGFACHYAAAGSTKDAIMNKCHPPDCFPFPSSVWCLLLFPNLLDMLWVVLLAATGSFALRLGTLWLGTLNLSTLPWTSRRSVPCHRARLCGFDLLGDPLGWSKLRSIFLSFRYCFGPLASGFCLCLLLLVVLLTGGCLDLPPKKDF